ncbi:MAG: undecaprenyl-diphosphate phosphatase [Gemmatimonadales bacterium]|nr:MAG: undecaprenyl-diphosphate phosphatase [Gemmatimonadales bacterium]
MSILQAVILGLVQGITEFLPVSSSGHLVIGQALLGVDPPGVTFEVVLHVATLCAVLWVYRARIGEIVHGMFTGDRGAWSYVGLIILASIPAGIVGVLGRPLLERAFSSPSLAAAMLLATGVLVWTLKSTGRAAGRERPRPGDSVWIGCAQAVAILPGISRSGATVAIGAWLGVDVVRVAEFSFLMSVPAITGAGLLQIGELGTGPGLGAATLAVGFACAAVSGIVAISVFVKTLRNGTFHRFAYYCWTVGAVYLMATAVSSW